jgi:hypothetical protein
MNWVIYILSHLMFAAVAGGVGLLVIVVIQSVFEQITGYIRTGTEPSQEKLEQKIQDPELLYELKMLLAEKRMIGWWKIVVLLIVTVAVYLTVFAPLT